MLVKPLGDIQFCKRDDLGYDVVTMKMRLTMCLLLVMLRVETGDGQNSCNYSSLLLFVVMQYLLPPQCHMNLIKFFAERVSKSVSHNRILRKIPEVKF